jgi:hypothetical protein
MMNKTPLAYQLFENIIEDLSDKQLSELNKDLLDYKEKYQRTYRSLRMQPFINDLFGLILDQVEYRNQMEEETEELADWQKNLRKDWLANG